MSKKHKRDYNLGKRNPQSIIQHQFKTIKPSEEEDPLRVNQLAD